MPTPARNETREEKLLRLKREFVLQNQLTSEAEESENLAAEQVCVCGSVVRMAIEK